MSDLERFLLEGSDSVLVVIDIQERLAAVMEERGLIIDNVLHLIELARLYDLPVLVTEQYPKGLGPTVPEIRDALRDYSPLEKITFSCAETEQFMQMLGDLGRKKVILTGMETHVCVLQTCIDLLRSGYHVHLPSDAVTSRKDRDKERGLNFMRDAGAVITCTETVLFQILKRAGTEEFKVISRRIR